jgi:hypothetical protein
MGRTFQRRAGGLILAIWLKAKITPEKKFHWQQPEYDERRLIHKQFDENGNFCPISITRK